AYGPTRYDRIGMYCSAWALACAAVTAKAMPSKPLLHHFMTSLLGCTKGPSPDPSNCSGEELASRRALSIPGALQADRSTTQCGNGHSRSFSFVICQIRASPWG